MKIYNGYKRLNENYTLVTDDYEFKMGNGYLKTKKNDQEAVFDVFFRKIPNGGGYAVMAGIDKVIEFIENLKFDEREISYFERAGYDKEFVDYLRNFKFTGDIYAVPDGVPVFPNEPIITVKAPLFEAQVIETALLSIVNGAMEHATGARRIIEATPKGIGVMEFGSRRADGVEAAIDASIYGIMAGCSGTSNVHAANMLNMKALGTMAHSWIESFDTEYEAFLEFAKIYPDNCILLVDTYDTLRSGIPNAIKTFNYMKENNIPTDKIGIRIDSGDLAYLSKQARKMLDEAGFENAKICLSNGLTAETIESLVTQGAKFDSLGVGDNISKPEGRMGCVYKEVALEENGEFIPKIKVSNDTIKIVNPGFKRLYRAYDQNGYAIADIMTTRDQELNAEEKEILIVCPTDVLKNKKITDVRVRELQCTIFKNGKLVYNDPDIETKKYNCENNMNSLYEEVKRTVNPHEYYVDGTQEYVDMKNDLIKKTKKLVLEGKK